MARKDVAVIGTNRHYRATTERMEQLARERATKLGLTFLRDGHGMCYLLDVDGREEGPYLLKECNDKLRRRLGGKRFLEDGALISAKAETCYRVMDARAGQKEIDKRRRIRWLKKCHALHKQGRLA
jgi:hypothetical protein